MNLLNKIKNKFTKTPDTIAPIFTGSATMFTWPPHINEEELKMMHMMPVPNPNDGYPVAPSTAVEMSEADFEWAKSEGLIDDDAEYDDYR